MKQIANDVFFLMSVVLTIVGIILSPILLGVTVGYSFGPIVGILATIGGWICTALYACGMSIWNEKMDSIDNVKIVLALLIVIGAVLGVACAITGDLSLAPIAIGLFFGSAILAAIVGLIKYLSDKIWIYRMC